MALSSIAKNDVGVLLKGNVNSPLHGVECVYFQLGKPNGQVLILNADVEDANSGVISYTSVAGDFDTAGEYAIQAVAIFSDGRKFAGSTHTFFVHEHWG